MIDKLTGKYFLYRLKDPKTGLYFQKFCETCEGMCEPEIIFTEENTACVFSTIESLTHISLNIDSARNKLKNLDELDKADDSSKKTYLKRVKKSIEKNIEEFDRLEIEILELRKLAHNDQILESLTQSINKRRRENRLENNVRGCLRTNSLPDSDLKKRRKGIDNDFVEAFDMWNALKDKGKWTHIVYTEEPYSTLKKIGVKYLAQKHLDTFLIHNEDFNLLRILNPGVVEYYIEIKDMISLNDKVLEELNLSTK